MGEPATIITADEMTPNNAAAMVPEQPGQGLLGWMHPRDVRAAFHMLPVTAPADVEDFAAACHARRATIPPVPAIGPGDHFTPGPTAPLAQRITAMQASDEYRAQYEPFGAAFAALAERAGRQDPGAEHLIRMTLAHEAAHVKLHRVLFLKQSEELFGGQPTRRELCRDIRHVGRGYTAEWWE